MSNPSVAGVIFVDSVAQISAFYQAVAAMVVVNTDNDHVVLETVGFQLTVHAIPSFRRSADTSSYPTREDSCIKLCFPVADIAQARSVAASFGGELWPPEKEWQARGFRACDGRDPEGNVFQLRQNAP
ncbi:glyoxalase/bleomycin resistance/dioxygenase family protein [Lysobacter rhizosphaerae]